jgi:hypothetical protein
MASRRRIRDELLKRFCGLEITECPFANLPEAGVEWTPDNHLRHSRFVALREDRKARDVVREVS